MLVAEDVDYDTIVQVMDTVRVRQSSDEEQVREPSCSRRSRWETHRDDPHRTQAARAPGKRGGGHGPLTLMPMIDMLTILVVYLLVHTADTEILPNTQNISIPQSISEHKPREATVVTVTRDMLYVNGEPVVSVADGRPYGGPVVAPLRAALQRQAASVLGRTARRVK